MSDVAAGRNSTWLLLCLVVVLFTADTGASELCLVISDHHRISPGNAIFLPRLASFQCFYQRGVGSTSGKKESSVVYNADSDQVWVLRSGSCCHSVQGSASTGSGGNEPPERPSDYSRQEPYDYLVHQSPIRRWLLRLLSFFFACVAEIALRGDRVMRVLSGLFPQMMIQIRILKPVKMPSKIMLMNWTL